MRQYCIIISDRHQHKGGRKATLNRRSRLNGKRQQEDHKDVKSIQDSTNTRYAEINKKQVPGKVTMMITTDGDDHD